MNDFNWESKSEEEILGLVKSLSNERLLEEAFFLAGGDDYDGCFTKLGSYTFGILHKELTSRLRDWCEADKIVDDKKEV